MEKLVKTELTEGNTHLKISVGYEASGINYFNNEQIPGGIYVYFAPVKVKEENGYNCVSQMMFAGFKVCAMSLNRRNKNKAEAVFNFVSENTDKLTELYKADARQDILNLIQTAFKQEESNDKKVNQRGSTMNSGKRNCAQDHPIAGEIFRQLGGAAALKMTGAKPVFDKDSLTLEFDSKCLNPNKHLRIKLNGADLYDVTYAADASSDQPITEEKDVFFMDLIAVCERMTGLYFHL